MKLVKQCPRCLLIQAASRFYRTGTWCKACYRVRARTPRYKELAKVSREKHKHKKKIAFFKWHIKKKYGLSMLEYQLLVEQQRGMCAVCYKQQKLHVDHDHATGKVRGLLCTSCNNALGLLRDDLDRIQRLYDYLNRFYC